ncbi:MAG TPA: CoA transferase [Stellaceae bacterium]|jgi:crotonobetainyl-CoA:carnitine CoA-transferase CaiB-like acyl-CoA transferase|nr:CoA transferase [Stellaceae bacterium]
MTEPKGPLSGITVLDLCSYLAGPYGCTLLADLGATVIKIESPQGDQLRQFPSSLPGGDSRFFIGANPGKLAIVLDLKQKEALAAFHRMVEQADVVVENFRPSVPARLGIDYPRLKKLNPRLVYAGVTGYGDEGPLSDKGGFDQVLQCLTGMTVFQGGGIDRPQLVLGSVVDYFTSALLAYGVAAALFHRERTGKGQYLALSLLRSALTIQAGRFVWADSEGRDVARDSGTGGLTGIHPTKQGMLYISVHSNHFFQAMCELVGLGELAVDPRYDSMRKRAAETPVLVPQVRAALAAKTALEWEELFGERVPCAAVRPIEDMFDHPQVQAQDLVASVEHPNIGRYRTMTKPIAFADTPGPAPTAAPLQGQHSDTLLGRFGFTGAEIAALRDKGAVK